MVAALSDLPRQKRIVLVTEKNSSVKSACLGKFWLRKDLVFKLVC